MEECWPLPPVFWDHLYLVFKNYLFNLLAPCILILTFWNILVLFYIKYVIVILIPAKTSIVFSLCIFPL